MVLLDGDPLKTLWYSWVFAPEPAAAVHETFDLYAAHMECGTLHLPDLYVVLTASEDQLRAQRDADATRSRRSFEAHLLLVEPLRLWFAELAGIMPDRVLLLDMPPGVIPVDQVLAALPRLPGAPPDPLPILRHMSNWLLQRLREGE